MRHCVIMTAYKDIEQINAFLSKIPEDWGIYVHLDKNCPISIQDVSRKSAHVYKMEKTYWASWEHLYVVVYMMEKASEDGNDYDYYHIVSGQDYFAVSPKDFDAILSDRGYNYIHLKAIPRSDWPAWGQGWDMFQLHSFASYGDIRYGFWKLANAIYKRVQQSCSVFKRKLPPYPMYGAILYGSLTGAFVNWVLSDSFPIALLDYLRNTSCAEEVFFATSIMNSPFAPSVADTHLRFIGWGAERDSMVLKEKDIDEIIFSKCLFCRKIDSEKSGDLRTLLNEKLGL